MPPLRSLLLRRLFLRCVSTPSAVQHHRLLPFETTSSLSSSVPHFRPKAIISQPSLSPYRRFCSDASSPSGDEASSQKPDPIAQSISDELLRELESEQLSIAQRLQLNFSHITPTAELIRSALNLAPEAGRSVLGFNGWLTSNPKFTHTDETISLFIDYFGRRKDFKASHDILVAGRSVIGPKTLDSAIDRFARAGRPTQLVSFFERMEEDYGFKRDKESLRLVVAKLCDNGYASYAEKMVKNLANEFSPDESICNLLIKGWCIDGKLDEARRLAAEMYRGGFEIGPTAYNAILDCVCKLCRRKDPFRLHSEAEKVLVEMDVHGVPRNVDTFNVLITNLCKIRKTEDAMKLFHRIGEWGCYPDETTFLVLTRSLYQAARLEEGDEMIDRMKSAGYGEALDKKAYFAFLKILCGIERIDHALSVFGKMKADGCEPGIKTYDLLMGKLCSHKRVDNANALFNEAKRRGVPVTPKAYRVDPKYLKKRKVVKKEKKRETLPEKMERKRRRLKQIRLSFVKKPKQTRAY